MNTNSIGHLLASGNQAAIAIAIETILANVRAQGSLTGAARSLGVPVRTMFRWVAKYDGLRLALDATRNGA